MCAASIYSALTDCLKDKNVEVNRIAGIGFDGASTFSGKTSGVQSRIKAIAPHALFIHCHATCCSWPVCKPFHTHTPHLLHYGIFSPLFSQKDRIPEGSAECP